MTIYDNDKKLNNEEEMKLKIRELLIAEYEELQEAADKIAPDFDYEAEAESLAEESAKIETAPIEEIAPEPTGAENEPVEETTPEPTGDEVAPVEEIAPEPTGDEDAPDDEPTPLPPAKVSPSKYPKPRYTPKSAIGRFVLKDKHTKVLVASLVMMLAACCYEAYDYLVPKPVSLLYTTYSGTQTLEYKTTSRTVGDLMSEVIETKPFSEQGIIIAETDPVDLNTDRPIKKNIQLTVLKSTETEAKIAGKKQMLWLVPGTVEENLKRNEVVFDDDDEIKPALDSKITDKTKIVVNEIHYNKEEKKETVEAISRVILDPSLTSGVSEMTEGNDGEGLYTYTTKYVNGKNEGTERELKEWITEPHDHVLRLGTASTGNKGEYIVARTFTANSTAYTASAGARGALGMGVHLGTCAVDPSYVPLRSELWIAGYGYAYANDTGGAVKGNVVDVYLNSTSACIRWGRRNVTAYVLTPAN